MKLPDSRRGRRHVNRAPLVAFDGRCWRIYVYDATQGSRADDPQADHQLWPLEWLCFTTEATALEHLARYGDYAPGRGAVEMCVTDHADDWRTR